MRKIVLLLVLVMLLVLPGCKKKKPVAAPTGPLVPTARERATLRAFQLDPASEQGQRKIHELRVMTKRIDEARGKANAWAEQSRANRQANP